MKSIPLRATIASLDMCDRDEADEDRFHREGAIPLTDTPEREKKIEALCWSPGISSLWVCGSVGLFLLGSG